MQEELHQRAWAAGPSSGSVVTLDLDSTLIETYGLQRQGGKDFTYARWYPGRSSAPVRPVAMPSRRQVMRSLAADSPTRLVNAEDGDSAASNGLSGAGARGAEDRGGQVSTSGDRSSIAYY